MKEIDELLKKLDKPPKLVVVPLKQTKDEKLKAKLLSKILIQEWGNIKARIKNEIYKPMLNCFLYGRHKWTGCGKKNKHKCKRCGWITYVENDPIYTGAVRIYYPLQKEKNYERTR